LLDHSPILVFQHMPDKHIGYMFDRLRDDGIPYQTIHLYRGEPIPDLEGYSALWVLGGSMNVWQEEEHPWLVQEKEAIRRAVSVLNMPYFGVCFGHQLLADAFGGNVGPTDRPEIGVVQVDLTEDGKHHALLDTLPARLQLLQWHSAEVKEVPADMNVLAGSEACAIHGISLGDRVLGLQSHIEVSMASIEEWVSVPEANAELERSLGKGGAATFEADARQHMPDINKAASKLYAKLVAAINTA